MKTNARIQIGITKRGEEVTLFHRTPDAGMGGPLKFDVVYATASANVEFNPATTYIGAECEYDTTDVAGAASYWTQDKLDAAAANYRATQRTGRHGRPDSEDGY